MRDFSKVITGNGCLSKKGGDGNMKRRQYFSRGIFVISLVIAGLLFYGCTKVTPAAEISTTTSNGPSSGFPFKNMKIRFFTGGDAGDAFGSIVYRGAMDAAEMLKIYGVEVEYVFSGWGAERMVSQMREAIAARVDAICMMGIPGDDALMGLAEEAKDAGIIMMYQNTNVPKVRQQYGGGYTGLVDLSVQGIALANIAMAELDIKRGDRAVVLGAWGVPGRYYREEGTAATLEANGVIVERIISPPEAASDTNILIPIISAQLLSHPETKMIVYSGGQTLSAAGIYMEACNKKPGEVYNIGFDSSPAILDGFDKGYIQLTADQQPYLQGFMPVMNAFLAKNFELSGLEIETGAGFITKENYRAVEELVKNGYR
jgi:simple sugar transport system substrate-binding protein